MTARSLAGRVAVVTGASRGIGKGIALELGVAGAMVYVTGRTVKGSDFFPDWARSAEAAGTIDATAEEVTKLGGVGIAVRCDHKQDEQVEALFSRIREEQGRLDILVNNVCWNGLITMLGKRFWELPLTAWDETITVGLRSHYVASVFAARIMVEKRSGLIVNVSSQGSQPKQFILGVPYGVAKAGVDKLTDGIEHDLCELGVTAVSIWPGLVATEQLLDGAELSDDGHVRAHGLDLGVAESPRLSGRAVVALATDPDLLARSGRAFRTTDLAREYGFTDVNGRVPASDTVSEMEDLPDFWKEVSGQ